MTEKRTHSLNDKHFAAQADYNRRRSADFQRLAEYWQAREKQQSNNEVDNER